MRIRTRIALVATIVTLPQLLLLGALDQNSRVHAAEGALAALGEQALASPGAEEACLAAPNRWATETLASVGPGRPPAHGRGPKPPALEILPAVDLRRSALSSSAGVFARVSGGRGSDLQVVARTGWQAPCDAIAVQGDTVPGFLGSLLPASPTWVLPGLLVALVMWLAVWPVVGRVQALAKHVKRGVHPLPDDGSDEIDALARAVNDAVAARRRTEEELRSFVQNTLHDVRIPLTVLRGHLVRLEEAPSTSSVRGALQEALYIGSLLDNLAAHARMEHSRRDSIDLGGIVEQVIRRHRPIAARVHSRLHHGIPSDPVHVLGDLTLCERALSNLVENALSHASGGNVAVTLDVDDTRFILEVLDDGPGIDDDELEAVLRRGYTGADARKRGAPGSGLGLSIVRQIADVHGWQLELANRPQGGLAVTLRGELATPLKDPAH